MKAAIYVRVSTEEQACFGYSLNEQREACRSRAIEMGAVEVIEFADEGVTGGVLERPGLNRLRECIRTEDISLLIVRDPDRISRRLSHQLLLTEEIEKCGVSLHFLDFDWQDTPDGRLFYSIRGAIAEYEKEKIRERMSRGKMQKARQGGIPSGFHAYGYIYQREYGRVVPHPDESLVVRYIYEMFVDDDLGFNGIARRLNQEGVPSRKGRIWHRQVVRKIISNPVYKGSWIYKDIIVTVTPLVDDGTWERAQQKLKAARRLWAGKGRKDYLLSGIAVCDACGCPVNGIFASCWGKKERRYTCYKNHPGGIRRGCQPQRMLSAELVERAVWEEVKGWLQGTSDLTEEMKRMLPKKEEWEREIARTERKIAEAVKRQEAIVDALAEGILEMNNHTREKLMQLEKRKQRWEVRVREMELNRQHQEEVTGVKHDAMEESRDMLDRLDELGFADKKALVRTLVERVEISANPGRDSPIGIVIYARMPDPETGRNEQFYRLYLTESVKS